MTRLLGWALMGGLLAVLLFGCATTKVVGTAAKSCEPSTDQMTALIGALASSTDATVALAAADGLGFAVCVLQRGADEIVASLEPKPGTAALALTADGYSPLLANAKALRREHP